MSNSEKPSIFKKILNLSNDLLDAQLEKGRNESSFNFGKAVVTDKSHYVGSQGFQEKPGAIGYEFQRQMAIKSSIVSAIIKTQQNKAAAYARVSKDAKQKGFKIVLKDEAAALKTIEEELTNNTNADDDGELIDQGTEEVNKSELDADILNELDQQHPPEEVPLTGSELRAAAKKELENRTLKKRAALEAFITQCGETDDRPFHTRRWDFESFVRATVWDSLVYDQAAMELVPKEAAVMNDRANVHHFYPVDGATIRYASPELRKYKDLDVQFQRDFLMPEEDDPQVEDTTPLDLDDDLLENGEYKFVQVIKGRIQRAFTEDELALGIRNPVTDIYSNGYALSELELLVSLVTSHLHTEYYNRAYFINGFSAKGILHIKANLNRSKLEELRRHWNHMVKGNRNSFQTPIMSGMDEIQWIPLTQSHSEMEFTLWLNYLIKMICAIYQIDPSEIGYGMKDEGGAGMSGDNTSEKLAHSKDKGFVPLMTFLQEYINCNVINKLDPDYKLVWVGLEDETPEKALERQAAEIKFKKTVNEIREEDGLPPIPGADNLILDPVYFDWFTAFSEEGKELTQQNQMDQAAEAAGEDKEGEWMAQEASKENEHQRALEADQPADSEDVAKSLTVEVYRLGD